MYNVNAVGLLSWCVINFCDSIIWICDLQMLRDWQDVLISGKAEKFVILHLLTEILNSQNDT